MIRKMIVVLWAVWLTGPDSLACDQCGVLLNNTFGISQHHVGYRLRVRRLFIDRKRPIEDGPKHLGHLEETPDRVKEIYTVHELFGTYHLGKGWTATMNLPVVNNYRSTDGFTSSDVYGFGDPWFLVGRQFDLEGEGDNRQFLWVGSGAKLPMGQLDRVYRGVDQDLDMQPGTGSLDGLFQAQYTYETRAWLLSTAHAVRFNSPGVEEYRYGHSWTGGLEIGRSLLRKDEAGLFLSIGPYAEFMGNDASSSSTYERTLFGQFGLQTRYQQWIVQINGQAPLAQEHGEDRVPTTSRYTLTLRYDI